MCVFYLEAVSRRSSRSATPPVTIHAHVFFTINTVIFSKTVIYFTLTTKLFSYIYFFLVRLRIFRRFGHETCLSIRRTGVRYDGENVSKTLKKKLYKQ